ncbi:uncharacterized protein LOC579807 isoform X2 [Strongylocentrotus purpuratus]|uniref:Uncharacterized protein n=1 Tax=Strongylocentrotus purpuratus TaxID=7668 RepID=A0A7M7N133_STRPU|nr:uncharacterized protein LOC579807 isoform X2 [Strongylocentrotus purpuratus]
MNGSPARQPARLSGSGGHQNAAFEPDTYIEPVMIDDQPTHPKAGATQNGGRDNAGFQSGEPAVLNVNSDTNGYTGLDNTHLYQDLTPNGHSNSKPSQKNGHVPQGNAYEFEGETGQEVHEYEYPDAPVNSISGNVGKDGRPYGFGRQESYMFKGQTERDRTREEREIGKHKSHCSRICAVLVAILILIIIGAIIFVVFEFIVNKPDDVTTTTQLSPTTALPPAQIYMVTTSAMATLDLVYSTALANPNTTEYRELEANFTYSVETAFQNAEMPDVTYEGVIVNSFSSGSVVVNFDVLASHTQNTPPGQAAEQVAINAVEREVTVVLTALTEDNLSDLPFMSFNVTGSEIVVTSTPEPTTSQQPTEEITTEAMSTSIVTTPPTTTTLHYCSPFVTPTVKTDTPTSTATLSSQTTLISTTTPSIPETPSTVATSNAPSTTVTPSSATTVPISTTLSSACQPDETVCTDGVGCVAYTQFCDGTEQCQDGSDEQFCTGANCNETELACLDQTECYPADKICDDEFDCTDGSDENFCSSCNESTCFDGVECYPYTGLCDGNDDCTDGSDEQFCSSCPVGQMFCNDGFQCYDDSGLCDGNQDCTDGSDESFCTSCPVGQMFCNDGFQCYDDSGYCDGNQDCTDGSDELFCTSNCETNELACFDGSGCYVYPDQQCDGISQCIDGEDELYCPGVCTPDELACATGDKCYNATYQCDGIQDCDDQSDEQNCASELIVINLADLSDPYYLNSPNYPEKYPLNTNQSWLFIASSGNRPRIDVSDMYTEPNRDLLSFYSADGPTGQPLVLSGAMTRSGIISYQSSSEYLYATFTSDNAVSVRGFYAGVTQESATAVQCASTQYDCNDEMVCMPTDKTCSCPLPPSDCNPPTDCFSCDSGKCIPFEEECDGENQCAFGEDERNCMQRCESFLCNDGICVANSTVCDYVDDCTGGEDESGCSYPVGEETIDIIYGDVPYPLTSYGYPAEYPNNVLYSWKFIAGTGYKIRLQFTSFSTHDANDYVLIGDGDVIGSDPFLRLYGGGFVPEEILSQGGDIWITMVTDRNFRSTGFLAHITSVLQNEVLGACAPSDMLCGNHLCIKAERLCDVTPHCVLSTFEPGCPARIDLSGTSQQYQSVTSPFLTLYSANFPALYDNDIDATVYLTAPAGQRILAATRQFDIEADYDFLTFYEGHGTDSNDQIARISGLLPNQVIMSTGNQMTIVFQSDYSFSLYGFRIEIEGQASDGSCNSDEFSCMNGQCRPNNLVCNGEIDCIDFSDEDKCPTCQPVPSECSSVLPWTTTVFPNARYQSESDALQRYAELESTALSCDPSGQLLLCAALFPECPHYGTTRNLCPSVCEAVIDNCPMLSELSNACSGSTMVDANNGNPLCEARNGDPLDTMVCGTRPGYQGDSEVQPRIIGGTYAEMGEFPWIGSLRTLRGDLQCGATLLNEYWAVTAAHCTGVYEEIVFGDIKIDTESSYSVSPNIAEIIDHPNYFSTTGGDDITLIRFSEAVVFNDYVRPICLPSNVSETQIYRRCYAAGWGVIVSDGEDASNDLLKVLLGSIENDACGKIYDDIIPSKICAGYSAGGYDSCQGDSGGPLSCEGDDGRWHLVGITSYGTGCGDPGFPGVYTRVSSFLDFIEDNITPTS